MGLSEPASSGWLLRAGGCAAAIVLFLYFMGLWLGRALGPLREVGKSVQCQSNLRILVRAEMMYADDYQDRLPPASAWMDRIGFFIDRRKSDPLYCPEVGKPGGTKYGYAMSGRLSAKVRGRVQEMELQPLIFDSPDLTKSAVADGLVLPQPGRHIGNEKKGQRMSRGNYIGLGGGGVRFKADRSPSGR